MAQMTDLIFELEKLAARLGRLRETYPQAPTAQNKRTAAVLSLKAIIDFVDEALPDGRRLSFALIDTMHALADVESGHFVGWLANPPAHRPKGAPMLIGTLRGRYAGCVELLYRQGKPLRDACREIFREIPLNSPLFVGVPNPDWQTVRRWRDKCTGAAETGAEKAGYDAMLALADRRPDLLSHMRLVLKNLRKGGSFAALDRAT
jgi:hypothetical protein